MICHGYWSVTTYSSWTLPPNLTVDGICGAWNEEDLYSLRLLVQGCTVAGCGYQRIWQHNVCAVDQLWCTLAFFYCH